MTCPRDERSHLNCFCCIAIYLPIEHRNPIFKKGHGDIDIYRYEFILCSKAEQYDVTFLTMRLRIRL